MRPQVGEVINGKYRLLRLIGEGGMGSVYEARHEYLASAVALKFLDPELARKSGLVARFLQEARVSASIRCPHVVQVSDVDETRGIPYLVMELLAGESLQRKLTRERALQTQQALDFALQILAGLQAAHEAGVVHRDLKPDNVYVVPTTQGPLLKLLDFGIAKLRATEEYRGLTRPGVMMGTPEYMAPEQAFSADLVDHRADIYALGVILFEMLAGKRPFSGQDPRSLAAAILSGQMPPLAQLAPSVPPPLLALVARAMAPKVTDRFENAERMRAALLEFCTPSPNAQLSSVVGSIMQDGPVPHLEMSPCPPATLSEEHARPPSSGVSKTLPPEPPHAGPQPVERTGTVMGQSPGAPAFAAYGAAVQPFGRPGAPAMPQMRQQGLGQLSPPVPVPVPVYSGARPRKKQSSMPLFAAVIGVLAAGGAVGAYAIYNGQNQSSADTSRPVLSSAPAAVTIAPVTAQSQIPGTPAAPFAAGTAAVVQTGGVAQAVHRDAGADGGHPDASFPFPFPSAFPSSISIPIQIPSGFSIPGFPPPQ